VIHNKISALQETNTELLFFFINLISTKERMRH